MDCLFAVYIKNDGVKSVINSLYYSSLLSIRVLYLMSKHRSQVLSSAFSTTV